MLGKTTLDDYLSKYAFTEVNGTPRINITAVATKGDSSKSPQQVIQEWMKISQQMYVDKSFEYCAIGSNSKSIPKIKLGVLPTQTINLAILSKAYPKYFNKKTSKVCGCFMDSNFYNALDIATLSTDTTFDSAAYTDMYNAGLVGGATPKSDIFSICSLGGGSAMQNPDDTSSINKTVNYCKNVVNFSGGGTGALDGATVNISQLNSCSSPSGGTTPTTKPRTTPTTKPRTTTVAPVTTKPYVASVTTVTPAPSTSSNNKTIMIIIIVVVILIVGGGGIAFFVHFK
jgi:hypothetical protein